MGRFALQQENEEEDDYSDVDSQKDEGSAPSHRWNSNRYQEPRNFWGSECPSSTNSVSSSMSTFHRALKRFHRGPLEEGEIPEDIDVIPQEEEDEDSYSFSQHQRQLARYEPPQQAQPQPPQHALHHFNSAAGRIHYHIYYTPPQQQQQQQPLSQPHTSWKWIALAAIFSHILYVYGPSARALQESGWSPFMDLMATGWLALGRMSWRYTSGSHGDWRVLTSDMDQLVAAQASGNYRHSSTIIDCVSMVEKWPLFGQPMVLDLIKERLDSPSSSNLVQRPWIFYAMGGPGVGKRFLAHLLVDSCSGTLLEVDVSTLPVEDELTTTLQNYLGPMDGDSSGITTAPTRVLLLSHVSMDEARDDKAIFQRLGSLFDEFPDWWQNVIVVVTTRSGTSTIDKAIRHYGKDSLPTSELVGYLKQTLPLFTMIHPEWASATILLPFVPLDRSTVATMVQTALHPIQIGSNDLHYLLDHTLEWQVWIDRQTQMELYSFLPNGGHDVSLLMEQLQPPDSCRESGDEWDKDSTWLKVQNGNELHLLSCENGDASPCDPICQYPLV